MQFGIRRAVDLQRIPVSLAGLGDIIIECALPYKLDEFLEQQDQLPALESYIQENDIRVGTVHAPQGHLTEAFFFSWALKTMRFAESVGASCVVFHPENCKLDRKSNIQLTALQNIRRLQRETSVTVAIETFGGPKRVLTPEDILSKKLPMVLDTSHLFPERSLDLIRTYAHNIAGVHLSESRLDEHPEHRGEKNQHQPVKEFAFHVLDELVMKKWQGTVTLEYMPWWHHRLVDDCRMLQKRYPIS